MLDPSSDVIVVDQPAFSHAGAPPFSASPRNQSSWSTELANRSSATWSAVRPASGQARQLCFEFRWNLQVHKASVGAIPKLVNVRSGIGRLGAFVQAASNAMVGTSTMKPRAPDADDSSAECDRPLAPFGLTDRQQHFLVTVMRHGGVFVGRQYAAFAGITHGQQVHDFIETLLVRRFARSIELGTTGRTRIFHVHYKPLYAAIGEPDNRNRRRAAIDRTIQRLMILDALLGDRSVTWLGSEHEKRRHFMKRLGDSLRDNEYPRLVFGQPPNVTVRYFPDKLPIGYEPDCYRHVFLYLALNPSPMDFSVFILRHLELLNALGFWTIRVLFPRSLSRSRGAYSKAAYELLGTPLTLFQRDDFAAFVRQPGLLVPNASAAAASRWRAARSSFRGARFVALRRHWIAEGDRAIYLAASPISRDTRSRGRGRVECVELPHEYGHLLNLARLCFRRTRQNEGDEAPGSTVPPGTRLR